MSSSPAPAEASTTCCTRGLPPRRSSCLVPPKRLPVPAARITPLITGSVRWLPDEQAAHGARGGAVQRPDRQPDAAEVPVVVRTLRFRRARCLGLRGGRRSAGDGLPPGALAGSR